MSVEYLRLFIETAEQCPDDVQRKITLLVEQMDTADDLVKRLAELGTAMEGNASVDDRRKILDEYQQCMTKISLAEHAKKDLCVDISKSIDDASEKLDQEKTDFISGAYTRKDEKWQNREPTPEPEEPDSLFYRIQHQWGSPMHGGPSRDSPVPRSRKPKRPSQADKKPKQQRKKKRTKQYCNPGCDQESGDMVGCENDDCKHGEWFHFQCVGLTAHPPENAKWFCENCRLGRRGR